MGAKPDISDIEMTFWAFKQEAVYKREQVFTKKLYAKENKYSDNA